MAVEFDFYKTHGALSQKNSYHVRIVDEGTVQSDDIATSIQQDTTLTIPDIKCTLSALSHEIIKNLSIGHRVHLEGLGYFSLAINGEIYRDKKNHLRLKNPHARTIHFRPEEHLLQQFQNLSFTCRNHKGLHSDPIDITSAEQIACQIIERKSFFTAKEFCDEAHVTRSTGYRLLKTLLQENKLTNIGTPGRILYTHQTSRNK